MAFSMVFGTENRYIGTENRYIDTENRFFDTDKRYPQKKYIYLIFSLYHHAFEFVVMLSAMYILCILEI